MYIPPSDNETDLRRIKDFILRYPFGLLVTIMDNAPIATHLPLLLREDNGSDIGFYLEGHIAKNNVQVNTFTTQSRSLIVFSEPHHYISHLNYENPVNVPTWNYISIHIYGRIVPLSEADKRSHINELMRTYEGENNSWPNQSPNYQQGMLAGIIAFRYEIMEIQARYKLSRNKSAKDKEQVKTWLYKQADYNATTIADYMNEDTDLI